nr:hypothetical protein [uncultured Agathobaculum sp.]
MKTWVAMLGVMLLLTGCGNSGNTDLIEPDNSMSESSVTDQVGEDSFPGTYTVPDGWIKADDHSTNGMTFYVEEGHENDELPDNISISVGDCPYSLDEHTTFRDAIMRQLTVQLGSSDVKLTGSGSNTAQDYVLYNFTIEDTDGTITDMYYILKDYGFCLVQATNFTGSENESISKAAQSIVDSFVWNEDSQQEE